MAATTTARAEREAKTATVVARITAAAATRAVTFEAILGYAEGFLQVINTDGAGISVRAGPGTNNVRLVVAEEGEILKVLDGPKDDEQGRKCGEKICQWWYVRLLDDTEGWVREDFTIPVSPQETQQAGW